LARSKIILRSASIFLATCGFGFPALAADLPVLVPAPVLVPVDPLYPVGLRPLSQVLSLDSTPSPFQLRLSYTGEAWGNNGGLQTGSTYLQNAFAGLKVDTEKAFGWTGGRFVAEGFYNSGNSLNENFVGSVQDPSAIDVGDRNLLRLYQVYYDQNFGSTDVRFGVMDLETEFGVTRPMDSFFSGAFAWTSTLDVSGAQGLNGPSTYPNTALGVRVRQIINDQWSVQAAVVNGMADQVNSPHSNSIDFNSQNGALAIAELDFVPIARTKLMVGYWMYTGLMDTQNQFTDDGTLRQVRGSSGAYVGGTTRLYTIEGARGLDAFVNFGIADPTVNQVDRSIDAGLNFTGLFDSRPGDKFGFGIGVARAGEPFQQAQLALGNSVFAYETTFELTYRAKLSDWLTVQPNIQYIVHPGFDGALKNDLVFGLHFEIGHLFNL
jgi:porin